MDPYKAWSPELNLALPHGWREHKDLSDHLLPPKMLISRELELEGDTNPGTPDGTQASQVVSNHSFKHPP